MKHYYILLLSCITYFLFSCNKPIKTDYGKNTVQLVVANNGGSVDLKWDEVNSSDFVSYEIYRSNVDDIDIIKGFGKIIATITTPNTTTFSDDSFVLDSSVNNNTNLYYKVAAVLKNRKVASSSIAVNIKKNKITDKDYAFLAVLPEKDFIVMENTTNNDIITYNYNTNTIAALKTLPINAGSTLNTTFVGINETPCLAYYDFSSFVKILNMNTLDVEKTIALTSGSSMYDLKGYKKFLYMVVYEQGNLKFQVYDYTLNSVVLNTTLNNSGSAFQIRLSANKNKLYVLTESSTLVYDMNADGSLVFNSSKNKSVIGLTVEGVECSSNGDYLCSYSVPIVYNTDIEPIATFSSSFNTASLSFLSNNDIIENTAQGVKRLNILTNKSESIFTLNNQILGQNNVNSFEDDGKIYIVVTTIENFSFSTGPTLYLTKSI